MDTCKDCRFFEAYPPAVHSDDYDGNCQRFPQRVKVDVDHWCGEFSGKPPVSPPIPRNANGVRFGQINR